MIRARRGPPDRHFEEAQAWVGTALAIEHRSGGVVNALPYQVDVCR
jgi:hypothetical protein